VKKMDSASQFWRRFITVGILVNALLLLVLYFGIQSAGQAEGMNQWVEHSQKVLGIIAHARQERVQLQLQAWNYHSKGNPHFLEQFESDLRGLRGDLDRLQVLTFDNSAQQKILDQLMPGAMAQALSLESGMQRASPLPAPSPHAPFNLPKDASAQQNVAQPSAPFGLPEDASYEQNLGRLFDALEANERALFVSRSAAVQRNARQTRWILFLAGILTFAIVYAGGLLVHREMKMRSELEAGLQRARELLGGKYEEGRAELGEALSDLNAQIRARQLAEDEISRLNKDLEHRVQLRTSELKEANRELEAFSYSVSHDLRAPLRHMDGFSRILQQEYAPLLPPKAVHYIERVRSAATKMAALVEDLLHLSRIGRQLPHVETLALASLVAEAQAEVLPEAGGRTIAWKIHSLPEVDADSTLLRQVFTNLFSNAIKFTRKHLRPAIEVGCRQGHAEAVIFVRDNGVGFDPRYADKLFGVFQRLHRQDEFEGTGIGLATVQRIVHKHGGRVWAESQVDHGATFYFSLPVKARNQLQIPEVIGVNA
jgi:signal transduction histidine kinase